MHNHPILAEQKKVQQAVVTQLRSANGEERVKLGVQFRELKFDKRAIDEEARTVAISFSSEDPYERYWGIEILGHEASEVRLGRLQDGAPLLFNHWRDDHLGVVEDAYIENKRGQSVVRFGNSTLASEKFQDVKDGILTKVSVGYIIHKAQLVETDDKGPDTYRIIDWEPLENSLVTIPADNTVGVGRSEDAAALLREFESFESIVDLAARELPADEQDTEQHKSNKPTIPEVKVMPQEVDQAAIDAAVKTAGDAERTRIREINAIGETHSELYPAIRDAAKAAADDPSVSVASFAQKALDMISKADPVDLKPATHLDLSRGDRERFSVLRAINAMATGNWKGAEFERECSNEIGDRLDREARGIFLPYDFQSKQFQQPEGEGRVMTVGGTGTGEELVGTDHLAGSFIDNLRSRALLGQLGAMMLPGLVGDVAIPRKTSSATHAFVAEDTGASLTDVGTGTLSLTPKILAGATAMSRSLLKQSAPSVEDMVMMDLAIGAALGIDLAGFQGSGAANNPTGVVNTSGVATSTIASAGSPTWTEIVEFETDVAAADGLMGRPAYVTTPSVIGNMKVTKKDAGSGIFLIEDGECNGYGIHGLSSLTANTILFGNWMDVIIAMWGVLDIVADTATKVASGGLVLRSFADIDVGVKHAASFSKNA